MSESTQHDSSANQPAMVTSVQQTTKRDQKSRLKRLIGSPHFKFAKAAQSDLLPPLDIDHGSRSTGGRESNEVTSPSPSQVPQATLFERPVGQFVRIDAAHKTSPDTHLRKQQLEQFVGWTEHAIPTWQDQVIDPNSQTSLRSVTSSEMEQVSTANNPRNWPQQSSFGRSTKAETSPTNVNRSTLASFDDTSETAVAKFRFDAEHERTFEQKIEPTQQAILAKSETYTPSDRDELFSQTKAIDELVRRAFSNAEAAAARRAPTITVPQEPAVARAASKPLTLGQMMVEPKATVDPAPSVEKEPTMESTPGVALTESIPTVSAASAEETITAESEVLETSEEISTSASSPKTMSAEAIDDMWASMEIVAPRQWPEMTDRMLTAGRVIVERLATAVRQLCPSQTNEVAIVGAGRRVGTTTIGVALARYLAEQGERVLLVDGDIHNAGLTRSLNLSDNRSWVTFVRGANFASNGIVRLEDIPLAFATIAPLRLRTIWPPFVLDHLAALLASVREGFDRVLIDVGTSNQLLSEMSGNRVLSPSALVIAEVGKVDQDVYERVKRNLSGVAIDHVIFAQNFARTKH